MWDFVVMSRALPRNDELAALRILLVEDEIHVRLALARPLTQWGYIVVEAANVEQARSELDTNGFDLAVVDINLPDGTGWDVLQLIRHRTGPQIPVVVISAIAPSTERLRKFHPFGVLLKPFPIESLRQLVARASEPPEVQEGNQNHA